MACNELDDLQYLLGCIHSHYVPELVHRDSDLGKLISKHERLIYFKMSLTTISSYCIIAYF